MSVNAQPCPGPQPDALVRVDEGAIWRADGKPFDPLQVAHTRHALSAHPLLQLPRLRRLALSLAGTSHVKYALPNRKAGSAFHTFSESEAKMSIASTFDHIEEAGNWVALYFLEDEPEYGALLRDTLDGMKAQIEPRDPGMHGYSLFMFIASPPTVTPFHIDRENNFNVQVMGRKHLRVWQAHDRVAVPDAAIEDYFVHDTLRSLHYHEELDARALDFDIGPGEGVYIPSTAGHYVTTEEGAWALPGGRVSVSLAMTYFTTQTARRARVHLLNAFLRDRFAAAPMPPGKSGLVDHLKQPLAKILIESRMRLYGQAAPRGMSGH
ncbi:cupin-like domain-containing protein [Thiomonas intermedia]|uniref:cupin-like domain-containing protein n=1 Tax=Thiomonas intermedia TaxID=926 RepID=UPI0009A4981F|nr:cupin-like domain-containing protein [Thiomonas intermedia]